MKPRDTRRPPSRRSTSTANVEDRRTVLIAVLGSTPAVLTETVWCLAREPKPIVPDSVIVITTTRGAATLTDQLLTARADWEGRNVWQALRASVLGARHAEDPRLMMHPPVVIGVPDPATGTTRPLDDIRSGADNRAAGESILSTVRLHTRPGCTVLGLLAGGRKTMGALLHAALSLAGRPGDRLLHVLVDEPYENPGLTPPFFFPTQPGPPRHRLPDGRTVTRTNDLLTLADVPLVALGELIFARAGHSPASFAELTRTADAAVTDARAHTAPLTLDYTPAARRFALGSWSIVVPVGRPAALCEHLFDAAREDLDNLDRVALVERMKEGGSTYVRPDGARSEFNSDDISNALSVLRERLAEAGVPDAIVERILPRRAPIGFNRPGVTVVS